MNPIANLPATQNLNRPQQSQGYNRQYFGGDEVDQFELSQEAEEAAAEEQKKKKIWAYAAGIGAAIVAGAAVLLGLRATGHATWAKLGNNENSLTGLTKLSKKGTGDEVKKGATLAEGAMKGTLSGGSWNGISTSITGSASQYKNIIFVGKEENYKALTKTITDSAVKIQHMAYETFDKLKGNTDFNNYLKDEKAAIIVDTDLRNAEGGSVYEQIKKYWDESNSAGGETKAEEKKEEETTSNTTTEAGKPEEGTTTTTETDEARKPEEDGNTSVQQNPPTAQGAAAGGTPVVKTTATTTATSQAPIPEGSGPKLGSLKKDIEELNQVFKDITFDGDLSDNDKRKEWLQNPENVKKLNTVLSKAKGSRQKAEQLKQEKEAAQRALDADSQQVDKKQQEHDTETDATKKKKLAVELYKSKQEYKGKKSIYEDIPEVSDNFTKLDSLCTVLPDVVSSLPKVEEEDYEALKNRQALLTELKAAVDLTKSEQDSVTEAKKQAAAKAEKAKAAAAQNADTAEKGRESLENQMGEISTQIGNLVLQLASAGPNDDLTNIYNYITSLQSLRGSTSNISSLSIIIKQIEAKLKDTNTPNCQNAKQAVINIENLEKNTATTPAKKAAKAEEVAKAAAAAAEEVAKAAKAEENPLEAITNIAKYYLVVIKAENLVQNTLKLELNNYPAIAKAKKSILNNINDEENMPTVNYFNDEDEILSTGEKKKLEETKDVVSVIKSAFEQRETKKAELEKKRTELESQQQEILAKIDNIKILATKSNNAHTDAQNKKSAADQAQETSTKLANIQTQLVTELNSVEEKIKGYEA